MYVNPFWLGVLLTIVSIIAILIVAAIIHAATDDEPGPELTDEEYQVFVNDMKGKKFRIEDRGGHIEFIEDEDNNEGNQ